MATPMQVMYYSYAMACPPERGDNPWALASGLSHVHVDKQWYKYYLYHPYQL